MRRWIFALPFLASCAPGVNVGLAPPPPVPTVSAPRGVVALEVQDARTSELLSTFDAGIGPAQPIRLTGDAVTALRDVITTELAGSGIAVGTGTKRLRVELLSCELGREQDRNVITTMIRARAGEFERIYRASTPIGRGLGWKPAGTAATASMSAVAAAALADQELRSAIGA